MRSFPACDQSTRRASSGKGGAGSPDIDTGYGASPASLGVAGRGDLPSGQKSLVRSERRRTERALAERDAILSALGQPVCVVTHEGVISYVNPAAVATLGFDRPQRALAGSLQAP